MFFSLALFSYLLDMFFAEYSRLKFIKHPIILIGNYIKFFEKKFYKDSILQGFYLTFSLLFIVVLIVYLFSLVNNIFFQSFLASFSISSKMLFDSVREITYTNNLELKRKKLSMLVSRDTKDLNNSDINKACIETYSENLSDAVIAPLFYLLIFGLLGAYIYKAINTLDSMVGYRNKRYEKFGKFSAKLDDIVNFIPSRLTAILISILFFNKESLLNFNKYGKKHKSPNAGLPISAMAICLNVKLGGDTSYFGKLQKKPFFGKGKEIIEKSDVLKAIKIKNSLDIFIILFLYVFISF